jgi:crossover junction endodeoxyribonuclease RuvC
MEKKCKRVIGFDPGYGRLGFGLLDIERGNAAYVTCGVLTTPVGRPTGERLHEIARDVRTLFEKYQPEEMVIESLFFAKNTTTALQVAEVRGVLLLLAEERGMPVKEVKPVEVKLALTGYGRADKKQMQEMIKTVLGLKKVPQPDDAADALAIVWVGAGKMSL